MMSDPSWTSTLWIPTLSLWRRELVRFTRQRSRWIGALGTPVVFWLFLGSGLGRSFQLPVEDGSMTYLEYSFPGALVLVVLFVAVFSNIAVIEDRQSGFLQAVIAAPIHRAAIVLGMILGGSTVALLPALLFLLCAPLAGISLSVSSIVLACAALLTLSLGLSALSFAFAWKIESTMGFHGVMNLILMPMWMLSGALFPSAGASTWMAWVMWLNPVTYGVAALRHALYRGAEGTVVADVPVGMAFAVSGGFAIVMVVLVAAMISRKS